jgi:ABC-type nitrate/sulfonate/bicarbonate transport system ATPase subunit
MIELKNISKEYSDDLGSKIILFKNISLIIEQGKVTSVIAPKGAGKSTLLKIVSGIEEATSGEIINNKGKVILIPSEPSSFPWLSVKENILFGLLDPNHTKLKELINLVGLEGYDNHFPNNKSYGFRFRISLARAIAHNPILICIDEPFNKVDDQTKFELYQTIREINKKLGKTFLFTTTNISEAIYLSEKMYLMSNSPGTILSHIDIPLAKDRDKNIFQSEKFVTIRSKIESSFQSQLSENLLNISI